MSYFNSDEFNLWYKTNKNALSDLYYKLIQISKIHGIKLYNDQNTINNFIYMMYNESSKQVINKELYPEYFYKKYNLNGYQKYKIINDI